MKLVDEVADSFVDTVRRRCTENESEARSLPGTDAEEERGRRIVHVRTQSEIPAKFCSSVPETFERSEENERAWLAAKRFIDGGFTSPGFGVFGAIGTGKTRLLCAVANTAVMAEKRAVVITTSELVLRLRATFSTRDETEWSLIQRLIHTPVLIVDDLGKEQITEHSAQSLFEFFNARYNAALPIVAASNSSLSELARGKYRSVPEGVDPTLMIAVLDRIREMTGPWIEIAGKSKRRA